jgi:putative acyl-CoA dehydrogenase
MCDAFLVLAQTTPGISCFLLPRFKPGGAKNAFHIQRLKDKLGNKSNASSEVEFHQSYARIIGEEGRGCGEHYGNGAATRASTARSVQPELCAARSPKARITARTVAAFGKLLIEQPLMRNVLADLALES